MPRNARPCEYLDVPANKVWGFFRGGRKWNSVQMENVSLLYQRICVAVN